MTEPLTAQEREILITDLNNSIGQSPTGMICADCGWGWSHGTPEAHADDCLVVITRKLLARVEGQGQVLVKQSDLLDLRDYVEYFGAIHEYDCPADDTCSCCHEPTNDAVNALCRLAPNTIPAPPEEPQPHRCASCGYRWEGELPGAEYCGDCHRAALAAKQQEPRCAAEHRFSGRCLMPAGHRCDHHAHWVIGPEPTRVSCFEWPAAPPEEPS